MPLSHLLDTSVLSHPIKDRSLDSVLERWSQVGDSVVCTSAICIAELLLGLAGRDSPKYWRRYREILEDRYAVLPFDDGMAKVFGDLSGELRKREEPKPTIDLMIAATAKHHGLVIATPNSKDFAVIPGVAVEDWSMS